MERILAGVTPETFNYLQLGAGAIIRDFDYANIKTAAEFKIAFMEAMQTEQNLGGTRGGIALNIMPTTEKTEIDGTELVNFIGDEKVTAWDLSMGASLVQFSPQSMQEAFPSGEFTNVGGAGSGITAMRIRQQFSREDYATNHTWISTSKFGYLMVSMFNTLSRLTGEITSTSGGEAVLPITINPKNADFTDIEHLPVEIWLIDMVGGIIDTVNIVAP